MLGEIARRRAVARSGSRSEIEELIRTVQTAPGLKFLIVTRHAAGVVEIETSRIGNVSKRDSIAAFLDPPERVDVVGIARPLHDLCSVVRAAVPRSQAPAAIAIADLPPLLRQIRPIEVPHLVVATVARVLLH